MKSEILKIIRAEYYIKTHEENGVRTYVYLEKKGNDAREFSTFIDFIKPLLSFLSTKQHIDLIAGYIAKRNYTKIKNKYFKQ